MMILQYCIYLESIKTIRNNILKKSSSIFRIVLLFGIIFITTIYYSSYRGNEIVDKYYPLVDAAMEIKLETAYAYIEFKSVKNSIDDKNIDTVLESINRAKWYSNAMVYGGKNSEGTFLGLNKQHIKSKIDLILLDLDDFVSSMEQYLKIDDLEERSKLTKKCNFLFSNIMLKTDNIETILQSTISRDLKEYKRLKIGLTIIAILFLIMQLYAIYRSEKSRLNFISIIENKKEELSAKVEEKTKELQNLNNNLNLAFEETEDSKIFFRTTLDGLKSMIIVMRNYEIIDVNRAFLNFFDVETLEYFKGNISNSLGNLFEQNTTHDYLHMNRDGMTWVEYVLHYKSEEHKTLIKNHVFQVNIEKSIKNRDTIYVITLNDITELEQAKISLEDSIEYASHIQHSLVPNNELFRKYCDDFFVIWHPRDVVGGDIYLLEELRNDDEMMLMVVDCTGHGVPGAFVTMLVKAIERQIVGRINNSDEVVNPAKLLSVFNKSMKHLLKQENKDSISNSGFDGGLLYYNKKENKLIYAGAKTPLYVVQNGELKVYKSDRHSLGYKRSNSSYEFTNYIIDITGNTQIYITTDGFIDQIGDGNGFSFGKTNFTNLINEYSMEILSDQQEIFLDALLEHQGETPANDDITVVSLKFKRYN